MMVRIILLALAAIILIISLAALWRTTPSMEEDEDWPTHI